MRLLRKYPLTLLLCLSIAGAYALFVSGGLDWLHSIDHGWGEYASVFIGGMLFSFGFTSPFGIGIFVEIGHAVHPFYGALLGGIGAVIADLLIFNVVRFDALHHEIVSMKSLALVQRIQKMLHHERFPEQLRKYLLWCFAGIIISSPLPDELGVILIGSISDIKQRTLGILCYVFNTAGIFLMLYGSGVYYG